MVVKFFFISLLSAFLQCTFAAPTLFYAKTMSDGGVVTVEKEVSLHSVATGLAITNKPPSGWIAVDCDNQVEIYRFFFAKKGEQRKKIFEKEERCPKFPLESELHVPFVVNDIAEMGKDIVLLFSSRVTELVVVGAGDDGDYNVKFRREVFRRNALAVLRHGKLVLSDGLHVLLELNPAATILWRVDDFE